MVAIDILTTFRCPFIISHMIIMKHGGGRRKHVFRLEIETHVNDLFVSLQCAHVYRGFQSVDGMRITIEYCLRYKEEEEEDGGNNAVRYETRWTLICTLFAFYAVE